MAEARNAADLYYLQRDGHHFGASREGYYTVSFRVPTVSTLLSQCSLFVHRLKYSLLNRIWPATPTTIFAVMCGVTTFTVNSKGESWVRSGWLADALWRLDTKILAPLNPFHGYYSTQFRVGYLASGAAFVGMLGIVAIERFLLKILFSYQGWLYAPPGKPSIVAMLWAGMVKLLSGKKNLTYSFSMSMPHLPVPALKDTCQRWLDSVEPLMTPEEFEKTKELAHAFQKNEGKRFQRWLKLKRLFFTNYVTDWWEKYCYLYGRTPIMINSNYYALDSKSRPTLNQTARAGRVAHHFLRFKDMIENETLEPMRIRNLIPLCMAQYERMFGTCRIPGRECDSLQHVQSRHIVVCSRGHYYKLNVYHGASGTQLVPYSAEEITAQLDIIIEHSKRHLPQDKSGRQSTLNRRSSVQSFEDLVVLEHLRAKRGGLSSSASSMNFAQFASQSQASIPPNNRKGANVAAFTGGPRTRWAEVREMYFSEGVNRISLDTIEKSAFMLWLDDTHFASLTDRAKSLFHGNGANRWFDKSINLVVFDDGYAGLNCEHSWADAPAIAHLWEFAMLNELWDYSRMSKKAAEHADDEAKPLRDESKVVNTSKLRVPKRLHWEISDELEGAMEQAHAFANELISDFDLDLVDHLEYGAGFIKKVAKCSPDAFVQMALQLAYYRNRGRFDLTYESSMTRLFREGRTETNRSLCKESCAFVLAMENKQPKAEVVKLLRKACDVHVGRSKDCMAGKGCDRHLFALYIVSKALETPSDFLIQALSMPWRLSTSQQPQSQTNLREGLVTQTVFISPGGGFGPVADDGYGISYMFAGEEEFFFHISSKFCHEETSSQKMANDIRQALKDMQELFE